MSDIERAGAKPRITPLPSLQILCVLLIQLAEPLASYLHVPFIVQLIQRTGITRGNETTTSYYVGLVESSAFVTEGLTVLAWARLSDRVGRKRVLVFGQFLLAAATLHFGLSTMFWQVLLSRALQGACNGNIGTIKTVMAEISDSTNRAQVFSMFPIALAIGHSLGPLIGGSLAHTMHNYRYPYLLPFAVVASFIATVAVWLSYSFKESHPCLRPQMRQIDGDAALIGESSPLLPQDKPQLPQPFPLRNLMTRNVIIALVSYAVAALTAQSIICILPIVYSTGTHLGGLGMAPYQLGLLLAMGGLAKGAFQLAFFPPLIRRFGPRNVYTGIMACWASVPIGFLLIPHLDHTSILFQLVIISQLIGFFCIPMMYGAIFILFTELVPPLGISTLNALSQTIATAIKAFAPTLITSLYVFSIEQKNQVVYFALLASIALSISMSTLIPKNVVL